MKGNLLIVGNYECWIAAHISRVCPNRAPSARSAPLGQVRYGNCYSLVNVNVVA